MDFPEGESDMFFIGSDDYRVYQCNLHQKNDQHISQQYFGHTAPITKIHTHPRASQSDMSSRFEYYPDRILSASMDWTVKLWSPKCNDLPLFTFENA